MESKEWLKSFSKEEYRKHIQKIQEQLEKEGLDVMLLSAPENIFYATGEVINFLPHKNKTENMLKRENNK